MGHRGPAWRDSGPLQGPSLPRVLARRGSSRGPVLNPKGPQAHLRRRNLLHPTLCWVQVCLRVWVRPCHEQRMPRKAPHILPSGTGALGTKVNSNHYCERHLSHTEHFHRWTSCRVFPGSSRPLTLLNTLPSPTRRSPTQPGSSRQGSTKYQSLTSHREDQSPYLSVGWIGTE